MQSFLAYIASQYRRKKEDVATDVLTYMLKRDSNVRKIFSDFVAQFWAKMPTKYSVESQTKIDGGAGIPDFHVLDTDDRCCAIVENKFGAPLTTEQPIGYFDYLQYEDGLIIFVVPERRRKEIWDEVEKRCLNAGRILVALPGREYWGRSGEHYLKVVSWDELIRSIENGITRFPLAVIRSAAFIQQLKELCDVAKEEHIEPLKSAELVDDRVGRRIWDYSRLAKAIAEKGECFKRFAREKQIKKDEEACGHGWAGFHGEIAGYTAWMGFWAECWSMHGISPIWIAFEEQDEVDELNDLFGDQVGNGQWFLIDGRTLAIPIRLKPDVSQEQVINDAINQLKDIDNLIRRA